MSIRPFTTHRSSSLPRPSRQGAQRGSIIVITAIALSLIVIMLIGTELGYMFYMKREFQKVADLAALAGAQKIRDDCSSATAGALSNANGIAADDPNRNMPRGFELVTTEVECGHWSRDGSFVPSTAEPPNAVRVSFEKSPVPILPFFESNRAIQVSAIAALGDPMAVFSVGTKLVQVSGDSLLGRALKGIGLDLPGTSLVGYDGLAQIKITPAGLLAALGIPVGADISIGDLNGLLAAREVSLGTLLDAIVTAGGQTDLVNTNIVLLNAISTKLGISDLMVKLGSLASPATGLFAQIIAPEGAGGSALNVGVSALDLIQAAIGVGTQKHFVNVSDLRLLGDVVTARTVLIEPPSIGIGGIGTKAYTAQLRTYVKVDTGNLPLVGSLVRLNLPIMIDAVNGTGTLAEMCSAGLRDADGKDRARIDVAASVLKICIGKPGANPANETSIFSTSADCETHLANDELLRIGLLGINVLSLNSKLIVNALPANGAVTLAESETGTVGNDLLLGTTVKNITNALLATLLGNTLRGTGGNPPTTAQREAMAKDLWGTPDCLPADSSCRKARLTAAQIKIKSASNALDGFLGGLTQGTWDILDNLLSLDVLGLVNGVGQLVWGLLDGVGRILGGIINGVIDGLVGNSCTGGGLLNIFGSGKDTECISNLADSLKGSTTSSTGGSASNALIALTSFLFQLLQPLLDGIGTQLLTPLLRDVLGLHAGQIDVNLRTLQCEPTPMLVY